MRKRRRVIIMGAGGRDFHNFNVVFRRDPNFEVVAFTASQVPNIAGRMYPPELSGPLYPEGIPIYPEEDLPKLIRERDVDEVVLSYSDLLYEEVMRKASLALSSGADFRILGPRSTMLESKRPVVAVCAARTGSGKSTTSRKVARILRKYGVSFVIVRHPMAYGDLKNQVCQRFESLSDLEAYGCTIEEKEEIEPHLREGNVVYAGVDYEVVLREAEKEAEVILWDGGNNDWPFFKPSLLIVVVDPLRPGHELCSFPGEVNVRIADVVVVNKVDAANPGTVEKVVENVRKVNDRAVIIKARSEIRVDRPELIRGKRVLVVEDGPSVTHGGLPYGAGYVAALKYGAKEVVDPRPYAVGSIRKAYEEYEHIGPVLPALGYGERQIEELGETIRRVECDSVVLGTTTDLSRYLDVQVPMARVSYELVDVGRPTLEEVLVDFLRREGLLR